MSKLSLWFFFRFDLIFGLFIDFYVALLEIEEDL